MKILDVKQGSLEWLQARAGLPTASGFSNIITPSTLKPSASAGKYAAHLLAEWFLRQPIDTGSSAFMERGTELEAEAANWYSFNQGVPLQPVGLCLSDCGRFGVSPDRLAGDDGLAEIKCPSPVKHVEYMLYGFGTDYRLQVQGQMWVTGRKWVDLFSYHPTIPPYVQRFTPDAEVFAAFETHLPAFADTLAKLREKYAKEREAAVAGDPNDCAF